MNTITDLMASLSDSLNSIKWAGIAIVLLQLIAVIGIAAIYRRVGKLKGR